MLGDKNLVLLKNLVGLLAIYQNLILGPRTPPKIRKIGKQFLFWGSSHPRTLQLSFRFTIIISQLLSTFQLNFRSAYDGGSTFSLSSVGSCWVWFPGSLPGYCSSLGFVVAFPGFSYLDGASFVECVIANGFSGSKFPVWVHCVVVEVGTGGVVQRNSVEETHELVVVEIVSVGFAVSKLVLL